MAISPISMQYMENLSSGQDIGNSISTENLHPGAGNAGDLLEFSNILESVRAQNAVTAAENTNVASAIQAGLGSMINAIESSRSKINKYGEEIAKNPQGITAKDALEMQSAIDDFAVNTQLLSKIVGTASSKLSSLMNIQ